MLQECVVHWTQIRMNSNSSLLVILQDYHIIFLKIFLSQSTAHAWYQWLKYIVILMYSWLLNVFLRWRSLKWPNYSPVSMYIVSIIVENLDICKIGFVKYERYIKPKEKFYIQRKSSHFYYKKNRTYKVIWDQNVFS